MLLQERRTLAGKNVIFHERVNIDEGGVGSSAAWGCGSNRIIIGHRRRARATDPRVDAQAAAGHQVHARRLDQAGGRARRRRGHRCDGRTQIWPGS